MRRLLLILLLSGVIACTASELASTPTIDWRASATQTVIEREATFLAAGSRPAATPNRVATNELVHATRYAERRAVYAERTAVAEKTAAAEARSRIDAAHWEDGSCPRDYRDIVIPGPIRDTRLMPNESNPGYLNREHTKWCRYALGACHEMAIDPNNGGRVVAGRRTESGRLYGRTDSDEQFICPTDEDLKHKQSYCWTEDHNPVYNTSCPRGHEDYWSPRGWIRN